MPDGEGHTAKETTARKYTASYRSVRDTLRCRPSERAGRQAGRQGGKQDKKGRGERLLQASGRQAREVGGRR